MSQIIFLKYERLTFIWTLIPLKACLTSESYSDSLSLAILASSEVFWEYAPRDCLGFELAYAGFHSKFGFRTHAI